MMRTQLKTTLSSANTILRSAPTSALVDVAMATSSLASGVSTRNLIFSTRKDGPR